MGRRLLKDNGRRKKVNDFLSDLRSSVTPKDMLYWITLCSTTILVIEELQILDYKLVIAFAMGFAMCFLSGGSGEEEKEDSESDG